MSSYGEKRSRLDEQVAKDAKAMQDGIQNSVNRGRRGPVDKKKNTQICIGFIIILIIAIVAVVAINL